MASRRRLQTLLVALCLIPGLGYLAGTWSLWAGLPPEQADIVVTRAYANLWAASTLWHRGDFATLFHPALYDAWFKSTISPEMFERAWSYPPMMVFPTWPLAGMSIICGYAAWISATMAMFWFAMRAGGLAPLVAVAAVLSPAALENLSAGQNGAWTAAFLVGGLLLCDRRPWVAGILLGFLTTKPHLALLLPICMLATRNWRTILAAAGSGITLILVSGLVFGWDSWYAYFHDVTPYMTRRVLEAPLGFGSFQNLMASPFMFARSGGAGMGFSYAFQAVCSLAAAATCWVAWRKPNVDPQMRMALTVALSMLATPYCFSYDMVAAAAGLAVVATRAMREGPRQGEVLLISFAWLWPGLAGWLGMLSTGAGFGPTTIGMLALVAMAFVSWRRLAPSHDFVPHVAL